MRRDELYGLQIRDIDLDWGLVHVAFNYVVRGGRRVRKDIKTHQDRWLAIDPDTCVLIASYLDEISTQRLLGVPGSRGLGCGGLAAERVRPNDKGHVFLCSDEPEAVGDGIDGRSADGDDDDEVVGACAAGAVAPAQSASHGAASNPRRLARCADSPPPGPAGSPPFPGSY